MFQFPIQSESTSLSDREAELMHPFRETAHLVDRHNQIWISLLRKGIHPGQPCRAQTCMSFLFPCWTRTAHLDNTVCTFTRHGKLAWYAGNCRFHRYILTLSRLLQRGLLQTFRRGRHKPPRRVRRHGDSGQRLGKVLQESAVCCVCHLVALPARLR